MYVSEGKTATVVIEFKYLDRLVVPEEDSVTYTVLDQKGSPIEGLENLPGPDGSSRVSISISGAYNTLSSDVPEFRWVQVNWSYNNSAYDQQLYYIIVPFLPISVTADKVRTILGLNTMELMDYEVDPIASFYSLDPNLRDQLGEDPRSMNDYLAYRTAYDLTPSLELKALSSFSGPNSSFSRFSNINWDSVRSNLLSRMKSIVERLLVQQPQAGVSTGTSSNVDPFTGS